MSKYINTFFMAIFVLFCSSCSNRTISEFEVPVAQDQQTINNNSNLDKFVDEVKTYPEANNTEAQKEAFYNDDSVPKTQQ